MHNVVIIANMVIQKSFLGCLVLVVSTEFIKITITVCFDFCHNMVHLADKVDMDEISDEFQEYIWT